MKLLLTFIGGFIVGILATFFVISIISSTDSKNEIEVQYIEVSGKKGSVTLYTGMSKDSVKILIGKPDNVDLSEIGDYHFEKWGYKLKNNSISDLNIDFVDGKLTGVRQD